MCCPPRFQHKGKVRSDSHMPRSGYQIYNCRAEKVYGQKHSVFLPINFLCTAVISYALTFSFLGSYNGSFLTVAPYFTPNNCTSTHIPGVAYSMGRYP